MSEQTSGPANRPGAPKDVPPAEPQATATVPCPACGFANQTDDTYCGGCRRPLGEQASATEGTAAAAKMTAVAVQQPPKGNACSICGFLNEADDAYCGGCRRPLVEAASTTLVATIADPAASSGIVCPACATINPPSRTFCVKCATRLQPAAPAPRRQVNPGMVLRFVLAASIGLGAIVAGARIGAGVLANAPTPSFPAATPITVTAPNDAPVGLALAPASPKPLAPLPDKSTIRLAEYVEPDPSAPVGPDNAAPWWSTTAPRVPAITQFDGGPLQKSNCVMAAGAMLARLAFGVVTTGSQLRGLQNDQEGASSFGDLNTALKSGWGVGFLGGSITALELRALAYAGAGIVVALEYGRVPVGVRLQTSFTGGHAVYIDAFRPAGSDGPAAYYVMDPIGKTWAGYHGGWWPAESVEQAGLAWSGGRIYATWAFAGGIVPSGHRVLPADAYPGSSLSPTTGPSTGPSASAGVDPMPTGDLPLDADPDTGDPPPDVPAWPLIVINANVFLVDPRPGGMACTGPSALAGCPFGIPGVIGPGGPGDPTAPPVDRIELLYANLISPGTLQIVFDTPPGADSQLWMWQGSGGPLVQTIAVPALIGTNSVSIANIAVDTSGNFSFFATSTGSAYQGLSTVGTLVVGG